MTSAVLIATTRAHVDGPAVAPRPNVAPERSLFEWLAGSHINWARIREPQFLSDIGFYQPASL
jgi:hypothetical protein